MASTSRAKRTSIAAVPVPVSDNNEEVRCSLQMTIFMTKKLMTAFRARAVANLAARGLVTEEQIHAEVGQLYDQATRITFTYSVEHAEELVVLACNKLQAGIVMESLDLIAMGSFISEAIGMFKHRIR